MTIDTSVSLSRWPFRRLAADEPAALAAALRRRGVTQAWAGTFDGVFHKDVAAANARLASDCRRYGAGMLIPFGSVNPSLPDWQEDLRRCRDEHRMPGIRLHPNYHAYTLADPAFAELLRLAARSGMIVQLSLGMEDERTQHPLMRVPRVNTAPLAGVVRAIPGLRLAIMNSDQSLGPEQQRALASSAETYFDFAMREGVGGVAKLAAAVPLERILFGSHFPLFYWEAALLKLREAGLNASQRQCVLEGNARRLLSLSCHPDSAGCGTPREAADKEVASNAR